MQNTITELSSGTFYYFNERPHIKVGQDALEITGEAFDTLLNALKIPCKFLQRFAEASFEDAANTVNFWLNRANNIGGVVENETVKTVFDSRKLYVPVDFIATSLKLHLGADNYYSYYDGDIFVATIPVANSDIRLANGDDAFVSVRLMFSECFTITPRVDAVLTVKGSFENYYYPIQGRKFRIVDSTPAQVDELIREFADIVVAQMVKKFVPALDEMIEMGAELPSSAYIGRLCSELRLSKRIGQYLLSEVGDSEIALHDLVRKIGNAVMPEVRPELISLETAREIELAISKSIVLGRFK